MLLAVVTVAIHFITLALATNLRLKIECLADLYRSEGQKWQGYRLANLALPGLGSLDFTLAFPADWELQACCQKVSLRFDNQEDSPLHSKDGYFVPKAEWTLCTPDNRLYSCYGFIQNPVQDPVSIPNGSWWLNVQHCIQPSDRTISYELSTFGMAGRGEAEAPRYSGTEKVIAIKNPQTQAFKRDIQSPCFIDGVVDTSEQWYGYLATMIVPKDSSISYRFTFKMAEPSNEAPFTVLFYSSTDLSGISQDDDCDIKTSVLEPPANSYKILPLSIGNEWSGCTVESQNGTPSYTCEGGRTFAEAQTVHIALSNCMNDKQHNNGLKSNYFFEFQNYENECPSDVQPQHRSSAANSVYGLFWLYALLNILSLLLHSVRKS